MSTHEFRCHPNRPIRGRLKAISAHVSAVFAGKRQALAAEKAARQTIPSVWVDKCKSLNDREIAYTNEFLKPLGFFITTRGALEYLLTMKVDGHAVSNRLLQHLHRSFVELRPLHLRMHALGARTAGVSTYYSLNSLINFLHRGIPISLLNSVRVDENEPISDLNRNVIAVVQQLRSEGMLNEPKITESYRILKDPVKRKARGSSAAKGPGVSSELQRSWQGLHTA